MTKRERTKVSTGSPTIVREVVWRLYNKGKHLAEFETRKEARADAARRGLVVDGGAGKAPRG